METERDRKYTPAIRWVRARMKAYYPGGGSRMTAALNLWHVLRDTSHRHGCGFDWLFEYQWATRNLLGDLLTEGLVEEAELEPLWDAMICQLKVSHAPEDAPDYWKKFPTFKKKEKKEESVKTPTVSSKLGAKKRGFFSRLISTVLGK